MATLTAWAFSGVGDADATIDKLKGLQAQQLISIQDAAIVTWEVGKKKPRTRQLHNLAGPGALGAPSGGCCSGCCSSFRCWARRSAPASALSPGR